MIAMEQEENRNHSIGILIAEDSRTQAEQLGFLLEQHGYRVTVAANGKLALQAAQAQKPTLVISDIVMPEMNGYEFCKAIKSDENLKEIPVILVTTLSDSQDVIRGLECGADNFIRKPYDEHYLLSRIDYLLMNLELRKHQRMQAGVEITLGQQKYFITAERQQMLDLLVSTYEQAIVINEELKARESDLKHSNEVLNGLYRIADGLNQGASEQQVAEMALQRALELPGVQAGWIWLREGDSGLRLVATQNLPPALDCPGALEGDCACRKRLLTGNLDLVSNIFECERLAKAKGDARGLRYHASVPLWCGDRTIGLMNLVGPQEGMFDEDALKVLYGAGNQVAVALERAHLHENLEQLVVARTAALRQSESWFRAVFNSQQDAVFVTSMEGLIINANSAAEKIFGYSVEELKGQSMSLLQVDEQHYREVVNHVQQSVSQNSIIHFEHELKRKNGEVFPSEHTFSPLMSETGATEGVVRVIRDITQRKQGEAKLKLFRTLLDSSNDAIEVLDPVSLHFFDINETGCRALGYSREELLSMSAFDIDPAVSADSLKVIQAQLRQSGRAQFETVHRRKDGSTFPVEVSSTLIEIDRPYLLSIARDITQRKANEDRIMRLNRIYSVLSGVNATIVRVREENELFGEACRIAAEHGGFIFAWIGRFDADSQQVTPVAEAGRDDGYLAQINLTSRANTDGNCPLIAQALTEAKPVICNDIASDERMAALRSEALSRGYLSVVVLPLILEGKPVGVFVLYAAETGVFDEEEMRLLNEIAGDISFAIDNLKKEAKLNYLAYYDVITGLPNRALFYDRLDQHLQDEQSGETIAVLAIDLERFRVINETFGRHAGDALLKLVAERLISTGVGADHLARISADCFAMVLSNLREGADVVRFLENQVATALSKPFKLEGQELRISVRAGIAIFPGDGKDADTLFHNAEAALKKTKLSGDKYLFYTPALNARVAEKLTLENKLRRALEQEQLVLHYQPKVDLKSNQIVGLEALMRWNDPETGLVPPMKFIPILEETGMIIEAGAWALAQAMMDYRAWQAKGLASPRVAVNVSQVQLQRNDFVSTIERVVSGSGGAPSGLEIEITESLVMQDIEANIKKLHAIREMGVEVAIDDFGTGYSSLSYIAKLPINSLKIDRAFIINMTSKADDLSIVSAIISLAHSLNLRVIAEGVETNEQAKLLRLLKCNEIQGFLFSPGVPLAQIEEFLRNKKTLDS
jgi:PAS domain S-box-containing protein/diguanylate cyclase (GGDEF)-like protein